MRTTGFLRSGAASAGPLAVSVLLWGAAAVALLAPLWQPGLPQGRDAFAHLYRLYELDLMIQQGILFPRWFPDLLLGYGYPLFNFYSPLLYFVAEAWHLLGIGYVPSLKLALTTGVLLGSLGTALWSWDLWRHRAVALVAGVAFLSFPYLLVNLYVRGAFAEAFAATFLPFLFLSLRRLALTPTLGWVLMGGIALAGLALAHNPTALFAFPFASAYGVAHLLPWGSERPARSERGWRQSLGAMVGASLLGLGLSAFFWLPALAEVGATQLDQTVGRETFFQQLSVWPALLQGGLLYDYTVREGQAHALGLVPTLLAALAWGVWWRGAEPWRRQVLLLWGMALFSLFLMLPPSRPLWEMFPLVAAMSFPWRLMILLGPITALLGASVVLLFRGLFRLGVALGLGLLVVASSVLALEPPRANAEESMLTRNWVAHYERASGFYGTTAPAQFLPRAVGVAPERLSEPARGKTAPAVVAPVPEVKLLGATPLQVAFQVQAEDAARLLFRSFAFPGWVAYVDGQSTPLAVEGDRGIVSTTVPPGTHTVRFFFEDTPLRALAQGFSGATLLGTLAILAWVLRHRRWPHWGAAVFLGLVLLGLLMLSALRQGPGWVGFPTPLYPVQEELAPSLRLLGWQAQRLPWEGRSLLELTFFWYALDSIQEDFHEVLLLKDPQGRLIVQKEARPFLGMAPTTWWQRGELVRDRQSLPLPAALPPGEYTIELRLRAGGLGSSSPQDKVFAMPVPLEEKAPGPQPIAPPREPPVSWEQEMALVNYRFSGLREGPVKALRAGEALTLLLEWQALRAMEEDYSVSLQLLDHRLQLQAQQDSYPPEDLSLTSAWEPGQVVRQQLRLRLPRDLPTGKYLAALAVYRRPSLAPLRLRTAATGEEQRLLILETLKVMGREQIGKPANPMAATFQNAIALLGYDVMGLPPDGPATPGQTIDLTLFWQALAPIDRDYTVFVHLTDEAGKLFAQVDSQPRAGGYPTSFWKPGEVIRDRHVLRLPESLVPGQYQLRAGLYLLATGQRLALRGAPAQDDAAILRPLRVR